MKVELWTTKASVVGTAARNDAAHLAHPAAIMRAPKGDDAAEISPNMALYRASDSLRALVSAVATFRKDRGS
jgi:hypothetical protein